MIKLNSVIYNKLILQAEEAKDQGLTNLHDMLDENLTNTQDNDNFSSEELNTLVNKDLWKIFLNVSGYHDLESLDVQKYENFIKDLSKTIIEKMEDELYTSNIGPKEPKLIGQKI